MPTTTVHQNATEAAAQAYAESDIDDPRTRMRTAIDAHEAALWQDMDSAPAADPILVYIDDDHPVMCAVNWLGMWMAAGKQVSPVKWRPMPGGPTPEKESEKVRKPILCLDFDGVIHSYTSGWKGADVIPDPPVPHTVHAITEYLQHFRVAIYSSRSSQDGGIAAMKAYVDEMCPGMSDAVEWPTEKPPAMITIDDRAITFTGEWPAVETLKDFRPWNKPASL